MRGPELVEAIVNPLRYRQIVERDLSFSDHRWKSVSAGAQDGPSGNMGRPQNDEPHFGMFFYDTYETWVTNGPTKLMVF